MTHLRKLRKSSPVFKCVYPVPSEEHAGSSKIPSFYSFRAFHTSKLSPLHRDIVICTKQPALLRRISEIYVGKHIGLSKVPYFPVYGVPYPAKVSPLSGNNSSRRGFCTEETPADPKTGTRTSRAVVEAQAALFDYLHYTRSLQFTDAEHMSRNSPIFLDKLLKKVKDGQEIGRSITRFLRFHPINEFEPFFESLGLIPSEFDQFLPRDLMFLLDDDVLLENYHVLTNYGIARGKIGKIFKEATGIFWYEHGVLSSKLRAYEELSLSKTSVIRIVSSSPSLLNGGVNGEFVEVLEELERMGIEREWIGGSLSEKNSYNWGRMLRMLDFFRELGFGRQELGMLIRRHPGFLLDSSGKMVFSVVVLLSKLGGTKNELLSLFLHFPRVKLGSFVKNLRRGLSFLVEIEMESEDIQKVLRSHPHVLGSFSLMKPNSVFTYLSTSRKRVCRIVKEDPHQLMNWALGMKIARLPNSDKDQRLILQKKEFLLRLGFVENSKEMKKALTMFRGKGDELQDRYDCLVQAGLDPKDVSNMIKMAPHILNQKIDVLKSKINFLVNGLGYPIESLVVFPSYMSYTTERVKLRFSMYNWLKDEGIAKPMLALSTILACSDKVFRKKYVSHHPKGPEVWEQFKKALYPS